MPAEPTPLPPEELDRIYRTFIRPLLFDPSPSDSDAAPTLVLLGGQPGAGKSRASARLVAEHEGQMTPLSGDDLRIFHPDYRGLVSTDPERAGPPLAEATRNWVRFAVEDALASRRSLLLEGTFGDPATTISTADRFREAGFSVRIVAIASPRVLSIVTAASRYLRNVAGGAPARFTSLSAHNRGFDGTTRLVESMSEGAPERISVLSRNGSLLYDQQPPHAKGSPAEALTAGREPESWGARSTMELLGELKQTTGYAISSGKLSQGLEELLSEAHRLALQEVLPRLSIDVDSPQAKFIRQTVSEQFVWLGRSAAVGRAPTMETGGEADRRLGLDGL